MIDDKNDDDNGWVRRSGGNYFKFENEGACLQGIYRGTRDGPYGLLGAVDIDDGERTFKMYTALVGHLSGVAEGMLPRLEYLGEKESRKGNLYKDFAVFTRHPPQREEPPF